MVEVVLPTPPFWLHSATTRAGPCVVSGCGSGIDAGGPLRRGVDGPAAGARLFGVSLGAGPAGGGAHVVDSQESGVLPVAHCRLAHQSVGLSDA